MFDLVTPTSIVLSPVLAWQGWRLRRKALRLPEAAGPREGLAGAVDVPPCLRLLIVGDSAAAGVGVADQALALAQPLALALSRRLGGPVAWQLVARTGRRTADAARALTRAPSLAPADVLLTVLGGNDVACMTPVARWIADLDQVHALAVQRCGVRLAWHAPLPPMDELALLPQPLRWTLGARARLFNRQLRRHLTGQATRGIAPVPTLPPLSLASGWIAEDGFHPGPLGYRAWVRALADGLAADCGRLQRAG